MNAQLTRFQLNDCFFFYSRGIYSLLGSVLPALQILSHLVLITVLGSRNYY